jgi:sulfur-carrier protein
MARVLLPSALASLFPDSPRALELDGATVADILAALDARHPGMRDRLCDSTPAIRRHINVFVAGERATLATPVPKGAEMVVLTAISGG